MDLLLIRHGHCVGQTESADVSDHDCELTDLGHEQARCLASALTVFPGGAPTTVLSSPLVRALDTAAPLASALDLPVQVRADLREAQPHRGQRGQGRRALTTRHPNLDFDASVGPEGWDHGDADYASLIARVSGVLVRLRQEFSGTDRVAVVTHGALASLLLAEALGIDPAWPSWFTLDNASVSVVRFPVPHRAGFGMFPPHRVQVLMVNSTDYLPVKLRTPDPLEE
jgi:2,3-bisphosphoglycerate-dependent phosphoglycerate mutase